MNPFYLNVDGSGDIIISAPKNIVKLSCRCITGPSQLTNITEILNLTYDKNEPFLINKQYQQLFIFPLPNGFYEI